MSFSDSRGSSGLAAPPGRAAAGSAPDLSVVLPILNEAEGIEQALSAIRRELERTGRSFELVCVDDGSTDDTPKALARAQQQHPELRVVSFSRNFGKDAALTAGLDAAAGRAVIVMDADLQHPPELLPELVRAWEGGFEVVNAVKRSRGRESFAYRQLAKLFNLLMGRAAGSNFQGASDYKLLDRAAVDALGQLPEKTRFFRGLVEWVGFRTLEVPFEVAERVAGSSKWSTRGLIAYSLRNLLAFSAFPLKLVAASGLVTLGFAGLLALWTLFRWLRGDAVTGFTTVILLQLILGGLMLTGIGIIALYLSAIYDELKARPTYVVGKRRPPPPSSEP